MPHGIARDGGSGRDVSNVTNMNSMFYGAHTFNQPIGNWDVSNVTNMNQTFHGARVFNQPIGNWDVSKVRVMYQMFHGATVFNQYIRNWSVSNLVNMNGIFDGADAIHATYDGGVFGVYGFSADNFFNQQIVIPSLTDANIKTAWSSL